MFEPILFSWIEITMGTPQSLGASESLSCWDLDVGGFGKKEHSLSGPGPSGQCWRNDVRFSSFDH